MRALALSLVFAASTLSPIPRPSALGPAGEAQYWCAMHPDVRSETKDRCPICGMPLVEMPPASYVANPVDLRVTPLVGGARLRLAVKDPKTRQTVRRFAIVHERPMHLFVVSQALDHFVHEHPVQQEDGMFMVDVALPRQGAYMAIAEFLPAGGTPQIFQQMFTTGDPLGHPAAPPVDTAPQTADGLRVSIDASKLQSGEASTLRFRVDDAASGAPVTDLEPYLGASAHVLIVPVDLTEAIHGHPEEGTRGPDLTIGAVLPRAGRYKVWLQVQRGGRVSTAAFVIDVR